LLTARNWRNRDLRLRRDHGCEEVVEPARLREQREQRRVHGQAAQADQAELDESTRRAREPEPPQVEEVVQRLSNGCLAPAGEPLAEHEPDLRLPKLGNADEQLEEDLEAARPEAVQIGCDCRSADEEETAHRVGDPLEGPPEPEPRDAAREVREERANRAEVVGAAAVDEAARHDQVDVSRLCAADQLHDHLGRVLQVGVHHAEPRPPRCLEPREDSGRKATCTLAGTPVDDADRSVELLPADTNLLSGLVVAVVDEYDLDVERSSNHCKPLEERLDVLRLLLRRHDNRHERRRYGRRGRCREPVNSG